MVHSLYSFGTNSQSAAELGRLLATSAANNGTWSYYAIRIWKLSEFMQMIAYIDIIGEHLWRSIWCWCHEKG